jgi:hypothetical protein
MKEGSSMKLLRHSSLVRPLLVLLAAAVVSACGSGAQTEGRDDDDDDGSGGEGGAGGMVNTGGAGGTGGAVNTGGAGGTGGDCADPGQTKCGDACVTTTTPDHCGACGVKCMFPTPLCAPDPQSGEYTCVDDCPVGAPTLCGGSCVNTNTDPAHCGDCATTCPAPVSGTATCENGVCGFQCNEGYMSDGVSCVDINECALDFAPCSPFATCTNTPGSYACACNPGYTGDGMTCTDINECALGTDNCSQNATCANTSGSFNCTCNQGYSGNGVTCDDIDECANGTASCPTNEACLNTPGSYTCSCEPPFEVCNGVCTEVLNNAANCGGCGMLCGATQACVNGMCVGEGNLRVSLTWSRPGDMDLHVLTPNGSHIYYSNKGPDATTQFGQLDADDLTGTGPENIFWDVGVVPPSGTYNICVVPYGFTPDPSFVDPVAFTLTIANPLQGDQIITGTRENELISSDCTVFSPYYVTSFTYP